MNRMLKHIPLPLSARGFSIFILICVFGQSLVGAYGAGASDTFQKTVWSAKSELFMKYDPPVIGQLGGFLMNLTDLGTFKPLSDVKVTLTLIAENGKTVSQPMKFSGRPGVFQGTIAPALAGLHRFSLQITSQAFNDEVAYDGFFVRQKGEAISEAGHPESSSSMVSIPFLKEQQWAVEFDVKLPEERNMPPVLTVSGELAADPTAEVVMSAPLAGMIAFDRPIAHLGQRVVKGEEICHIETPISQEGGADQLAAQVAEARNKVLLAQKELDRSKRLVEGKAAPRKRLEEAEIMLKIAQSNLAPLNKALSRIQSGAACGHLILKAPIAGTVVEVSALNGAYMQAGQPLLKIVNTSKLWLKANVPVAETTHSEHLSSAYFTISGSNQEFKPTRLITVNDMVDATTRTVQTIFEVDNADAKLKIGMFASIFLQNGLDSSYLALAVPNSAIHEDEGKYFVYVQAGGETFERREVTIGNKTLGLTAVKDGIAVTDRVVAKGGYYIKQASQGSKTPEGHGHEH